MTRTTDETYNGWANRETWALNLWLNNDEGLYELQREFARTFSKAAYRSDLETRDWFSEEIVPLLQETELGRSALEDIGSLWRVDWQATAEAIRESIE
jgi:hypothetical protein